MEKGYWDTQYSRRETDSIEASYRINKDIDVMVINFTEKKNVKRPLASHYLNSDIYIFIIFIFINQLYLCAYFYDKAIMFCLYL